MPTQRCGVADAITTRTGLTRRGWYRIGILLFLLITLAFQGTMPSQQSAAASNAEWPLGGQNLANTRDQDEEATIGTGTVGGLAPTWVFTTGGNVSATPAVVAGAVYVPDWAGNLYKIDATTGSTIWSHRISDYDGVAGSVSRTSPAVVGNTIYIGDQNGAHLMAIDANTGNLIWIAQLDPHPYAIITQSPVVYNGVVYVGVSSTEEAAAANPNYACCTFRGSVVALDAGSGRILWQTYMVPANGGQPGGYSGGAVWSSTPVVDSARNSLYITTGNNYTVPASVATCENNGGGSACDTPENHFDSILSLDLTTGAIKWATGTQTFDAFTVACRRGPPANCPPPAGPDYDFGSGANLFTVTVNGQPQTMLGAGQKSGTYWALNPDTGQILWATAVGPGGVGGGIEWGTATDGQRIYVAIANSGRQPYTLIPSGQTVTGGAWSALDAATGSILWQTADPLQAQDSGAVSVANGVVYAGSMDSAGHMYALDASTGTILWSFASGGSVAAGAAIANGTVYWGSGYSRVSGTRSNNKIFAFGLNAATATPTTSSATITPTDTPTSTATPTDTPTDVATATPTDTPTNTPTTAATPTDSASATPTDTPSDVATATSTDSPTAMPTDSPTATPTDSPTATPTDSPTDAANAATDTPTDVATITPTDTPTTTPTNAATDTPTDTATSPAPSPTETAAPTNTPTDTPTDTPTATNSPTPTATNSPTVTATNSPTATATSTAVAARLALNPLRVVPFQTLALTGTGFLSGQKVHVSLDSITSTALLTPTVGVGGAFTATLSVPQAISGTHTLLAVGLPQGPGAYAQLQVAPEVILSPSSGAAGSAATAIGFGFGRGETVRLYWDVPSTLLGTTSSSAVGSFYGGTGSTRQISFTVPSGAAAGRHYVVAVGQSSGARAYATFTVH